MHLVMEIRELLIKRKVTSSNDGAVIDILCELAKSCENLEFSALYRFWQSLLNIELFSQRILMQIEGDVFVWIDYLWIRHDSLDSK